MIRFVLLALLLIAAPARSEEIVLGLSAEEVAITATFDGSDILIFGAVERTGPAPAGPPLQVIMTVAGPETPVTVRRQERVAGIWMNTDQIIVDRAPSFFAVASSGPLDQVLSATEDLRHSITIDRTIRSVGHAVQGSEDYSDALIRIRAADDLYQVLESAVDVERQTLFYGHVVLPANLIEGEYDLRIFLTRDRQVVDVYETSIPVAKVGLERWLFNLSRDAAFLYGLLSLALAVMAGWLANTAFQWLRR